VGTAVLAEFSRRRGRDVLLGSFALAWQIGFSVAFIVGILYDGTDWRLLLASSAVPALITFILRLGLPESPMWLKARGRNADADAIVLKHFGPGFAIPTMTLEEEHPSPRELFRHKNWRAHLYAGVFWFCQIGPFFAIFTFVMPVFKSLRINSGVTVEILLNGLQILGAIFGLLLLHWLTRGIS
jgi:putative MFS transporter